MAVTRISFVGLFTSDPRSVRARQLEKAFRDLGIRVVRVLPWAVRRMVSTERHGIVMGTEDLTTLDMMVVLDLGGHDMGVFFHRVGLLTALHDMGVEIVNPVNSILQMRNKAECMRRLVSAGLPVPETLITESIDEAAKFVREHAPCVLKPIMGFGGVGVQLVQDQFDLSHILDYLKFYGHVSGRGAYLLQEFVNGLGFDIRALVVDGEVISTMQRVSACGIVTNIHAGGTPRVNDIDVDDIALRAAKSVRGRMVGVDIIPDNSGGLWVLEVNATPGWIGLQSVTRVDISEEIARRLSRP
ncbi:MAG: ATP-grasp domain-containing protein [Candidatus Thorarchaeota archaeon]